MEQLRIALAWIARYHFWLLCGVVVIVGVGCWYLATGSLQEQYAQDKVKIQQVFSSQQSLQQQVFFANDAVLENQQQQTKRLVDEVRGLWQQLYNRQREEVLQWPQVLGEGFRRQLRNLSFGQVIPTNLREHYTAYIRGRFDELPKIIHANQLDDNQRSRNSGFRSGGLSTGGFRQGGLAGGGFRGRDTDQELDEVDYTVNWHEEDQRRIQQDLSWNSTASHWKIWTTQEDLWVYETLLRAVAATNRDRNATRYSNATITDIYHLQVGQLAAQESRTSGRIKRLQGAGSLASGMGEASGFESSFESGGNGLELESGGFDGVATAAGAEKGEFLSGRYLDMAGRPIPVAADGAPLSPTQFGQEMKRLPVRLALRMDSRWISLLVTHLANAPLPVRVTEVRIAPDGSDRGTSFGRLGGGQEKDELAVFNRQPQIKRVIVQGVILIFNPPDEELLRLDESDATDIRDGLIEANTPLRRANHAARGRFQRLERAE